MVAAPEFCKRRTHLVPAAVAASMLLAALADWPSGYYLLLRWVVCAAAVIVAYRLWEFRRSRRAWGFGVIALLFNTVFPIHLDRNVWQVIDLLAAGLFVLEVAIGFLRGAASPARQLIEARMRQQHTQAPLSVLSNKILSILSHLRIPGGPTVPHASFNDDNALFEVGCYLYFLVDYWHVKHGHADDRNTVVTFLMDDFLTVFSTTLEVDYANSLLDNRLSLYGEFANSEDFIESSMFWVEELVFRTANHARPALVARKNMEPIHGGLTARWSTGVAIQEFLVASVPLVYEELKAFYAR